ncbi:hypothetical protein AKJ57_02265 [candidate division MSBL1 archaeon SCGC-AAA259A05]|uniref:Uncharacterized protein n=1 Tax=candidate division MSBL1 archaeon SCGC-AAA259A05 TaxID=1698259 RepID=A0A133UAC8_9EURY|nr:hypothetical protein AKJ57_02265 [candidate division MSBL1 archaeon SCGC-AAA259A05]
MSVFFFSHFSFKSVEIRSVGVDKGREGERREHSEGRDTDRPLLSEPRSLPRSALPSGGRAFPSLFSSLSLILKKQFSPTSRSVTNETEEGQGDEIS